MNFKNRVGALLLVLTLGVGVMSTVILPTSLHAQATSGNITGSVTDKTGAAIPNAKITATNTATGVVYNSTANSNGEFRIGNLPIGSYDLKGSAAGFAAYRLQGFAVRLNQSLTAKLTLPVATATTSVEVSDQASVALDTTTVQLTQSFSTQELSALPTASVGLGVLNISLLSPGVATSGPMGAGTGPSVGGQRPRANNFTIEGIDNNDKTVTGPLVYVPNDAVAEFTLITNQFSPEFGHSTGGQFNQTVISGTNKIHGKIYEYFDNRNLNAIDYATARQFVGTGDQPYNPRYDFNRYGGQAGAPVLKNKIFLFGNYERQTTGQSNTYSLCTPTAAGLTTLRGLSGYGFSTTNLNIFNTYTPASPRQVNYNTDNACFNSTNLDVAKDQVVTVYSGTSSVGNSTTGGYPVYGSGSATNIPLGNYSVSAPSYSNFKALTTSGDWAITSKDNLRVRYIYNAYEGFDTGASLPVFFEPAPSKYHLVALSEFHNFSPSLTNEVRLGFNRYSNIDPAGSFSFPGLDRFPDLSMYDAGSSIGPSPNAPQTAIQNLYQLTDNITWVKGNHTVKVGFDGRKFISPQNFVQRGRGDYEWYGLTEYLHDLAPTSFGERNTGINYFFYGDQVALYGYANDTWRVRPGLTVNYGLRYEFTSVPQGERNQSMNSAASVPGLISFNKPKPQYFNFAPRVGFDWSPDSKTSVRAGFGMAYDVLYDNIGSTSYPPQVSTTLDVGNAGQPNYGDANFLANGGLPNTYAFNTIAGQRAATASFVPDQKLPYAETWSLGVQRVFRSNYTAEIRYVGDRGIHLPAQIRINRSSLVTPTNFVPTLLTAPGTTTQAVTLQTIKATSVAGATDGTGYVPAYYSAGFTSNLVSFAPAAESNYNGMDASITRRFQQGMLVNLAYTWSKAMDDATADFNSTIMTPRRAQDGLNMPADYSRSALDRTQRLTLAVVYDVPFFKQANPLLKNLVGNWEIAPVYSYQSPEYATVQSGIDSNLNGDNAGDRTVINPHGVKGTGSGVTKVYDPARASLCPVTSPVTTTCAANLVAYVATNPNAYYIQANAGTLATASRNTLPIRPTDNLDVTVTKKFNILTRYSVEFAANAFNALNHPQFLPGSLNTVNQISDNPAAGGLSGDGAFINPVSTSFNHAEKVFGSNSRTLQLNLKLNF
jgi:hypothetical protein